MISVKRLFEPCSFEEANLYSPWPDRITGQDMWKRESRSTEEVVTEYDSSWYKPQLKSWRAYASGFDTTIDLSHVIRFYKNLLREVVAVVEHNTDVYKSSVNSYLMSASEKLYIGNLLFALETYESLIDETFAGILINNNVESVIELGCGNGGHLFRLMDKYGMQKIVGGEVCPSAIALGNEVASHAKVDASFEYFDFFSRSAVQSLVEGITDYIIFTSHALEQLPSIKGNFFESIINLNNPPRLVINFEPVVFSEQSQFASYCEKYAMINNYNVDYWERLKDIEKMGRLEILDINKRIFGYTAFNPTSIIVWRPII